VYLVWTDKHTQTVKQNSDFKDLNPEVEFVRSVNALEIPFCFKNVRDLYVNWTMILECQTAWVCGRGSLILVLAP
jgi:hypothetical protein